MSIKIKLRGCCMDCKESSLTFDNVKQSDGHFCGYIKCEHFDTCKHIDADRKAKEDSVACGKDEEVLLQAFVHEYNKVQLLTHALLTASNVIAEQYQQTDYLDWKSYYLANTYIAAARDDIGIDNQITKELLLQIGTKCGFSYSDLTTDHGYNDPVQVEAETV